ncbi:hypothetical protein V5799_000681 [Amblyomma americanum]|uniref:RING-CH-type domain-containing protein n=1 Tax=Amblyomma americanum TaxID=6943 RepID=A0AAQ4D2D0_AMBAM
MARMVPWTLIVVPKGQTTLPVQVLAAAEALVAPEPVLHRRARRRPAAAYRAASARRKASSSWNSSTDYRSPCRCPNAFAHRSCLEEVLYREAEDAACPLCGARYPLQRRTKPMWRWFWEQESRDDVTLFLANLAFSVRNVGVLGMAWMYALIEHYSSSGLPPASLASALFILSVFRVAFGCIRFRLLYMTYQPHRRE